MINPDGSVDLFSGPTAPARFQKNHMTTVGNDGWFVHCRPYAPLRSFIDKTFSLPDFEQIQA